MDAERQPKRLIRIDEVCDRVGMKTTTVYECIKDGTFPKQVKLGTLVAWVESEIDDWIQARIDERNAGRE